MKSHNDLVHQVGWLFIEVLALLTTTLYSLEIIRPRSLKVLESLQIMGERDKEGNPITAGLYMNWSVGKGHVTY